VAGEAQDQHQRGMRLYLLQRYPDALAAFEAAYLAKADPAILFNIGQCYRLMGRPADAIRAYRNYLSERPGAPNRADVERFIEELERTSRRERTPRPIATPHRAAEGGDPEASWSPVAPGPVPLFIPGPVVDRQEVERLRKARRLRNKGIAELVLGSVFAAASIGLMGYAAWHMTKDAKASWYDSTAEAGDREVLGPGLPGLLVGLASVPLLILGPSDYLAGDAAVRAIEYPSGRP
jgi:tetratricopeptide (TPR) repeat protein